MAATNSPRKVTDREKSIEDRFMVPETVLSVRKKSTSHYASPNIEKKPTDSLNTTKNSTDIGITALHIAAEEGDLNEVEDLLKASRFNIDAPNREGMTALALAAKNGNVEVVSRLLECGAKANLPDKTGETALHWAAQHNHVSVLEQLLAAGDKRETSLDEAAIGVTTEKEASSYAGGKGKLETRAGIQKAYIDLLDSKSRTPLYLAVERGAVDTVGLLLERGADTRLPDERGQTALDAAAIAGKAEVIELLQSKKSPLGMNLVRSYSVLPDFTTTISPSSESLGRVLSDPKSMQPLDTKSPHEAPLPNDVFSAGFKTTLPQTQTSQYGILGDILGRWIGLKHGSAGTLEVATIREIWFKPTDEYVDKSLKNLDASLSKPIYMITGMKIAQGVSFTPEIKAAESSDIGSGEGIKSVLPTEFVFAVQLLKLQYKRSWTLGGSKELEKKLLTRGALF